MINFINGTAGSGKGSYIIERIRERINANQKMYLIVPEQEAVIWEARVCRELPPSTFLSLEVVSFKRLANTVARKVGGLTYNYAGDGKKTLLMWSALTSVYDSLNVYGFDKGREDTYIQLMLDTVKELKINGISPEMLDKATSVLSGKQSEGLKKRISDLALIYSAYTHIQNTDASEDPDNILTNLYDTLCKTDFFKNSCVFIDSFFSLTKTECDIVNLIMKQADDVFITFTISENPEDVHFKHVRKYYGTLLRHIPLNCDFKEIFLKGSRRTDKKSLLTLRDNLWNFQQKSCENDGSIRVIRCRDRYDEARLVGSLIEKYVHEGASYSEIAIIARDIEKLRGILDSRLDALDIPYHLAKRYGISSYPVLKLITSLLRTVSSGLSRESVVSCLKTGLCNVKEFESASFEEYTATWNIRGFNGYLSDEIWSMNPAGFTTKTDSRTRQILIDANNVKNALKKPLLIIHNVFKSGTGKVSDIAKAIYEILEELDVYSSMNKKAAMLDACDRDEEAKIYEKLYGMVIEALDLMVSTIPDAEIDASRFSRLFVSVASSFDMGSIPAGCDVVTLGSAHGIRCDGIKHVILVGCIEGEFPKAINDTGFFSDSDRILLENCGINLSENTAELTGEELFRFWRCAVLASESVTLTVPLTDSGKNAQPSIGIKRVCDLFGIEPENFSDIARYDSVWSISSAKSRLLECFDKEEREELFSLTKNFPELSDVRSLSGKLTADNEKASSEYIEEYNEKVYHGTIPLTQSRLDCFSNCRFAYYMKYILKINEPKKASVGFLDVGNMIHRILELFFIETSGMEFPLKKSETETIVDRIIKNYISTIMNGQDASPKQKYLFSRLRSSVLVMIYSLMEEFAQSKFKPYSFELEISPSSSEKPCPLKFSSTDGTPAYLFGTVDRVDIYREADTVYIRVIDYKTGKKEFKAADIKKGMNLQLLIYLFTLWKGDDCDFRRKLTQNEKTIVPAGMLYFSANSDNFKSNKYLTAELAMQNARKQINRSGLLLNEESVLYAMDRELSGKYIPDPSKKSKNPENRVFRSLDEFEELYLNTNKIITEILDEIKGGVCSASPDKKTKNSHCKYCNLKPICRYDFSEKEVY